MMTTHITTSTRMCVGKPLSDLCCLHLQALPQCCHAMCTGTWISASMMMYRWIHAQFRVSVCTYVHRYGCILCMHAWNYVPHHVLQNTLPEVISTSYASFVLQFGKLAMTDGSGLEFPPKTLGTMFQLSGSHHRRESCCNGPGRQTRIPAPSSPKCTSSKLQTPNT